jgi:threonine synthase
MECPSWPIWNARAAVRSIRWAKSSTSGLRVSAAIGDFLILNAVHKSRGVALAGSDADMLTAVREIAETEGLITSPEGGATLAGLKKLLFDGFLGGHESIVLFITATGYKYLEALEQIV